ncbi:MAG: hypothetical protein E7311_01415 [Clostridiales bacterium]|nr:hypothetical protein [Clostridiales bacterium]
MNSNTYHHILGRETECILGSNRYYYVRCAKEIEPFIRKYFKKFREQNFTTDNITNSKVDYELFRITEMIYYLSMNTIEGRKIGKRELKAIEAIFNLLYDWFDDVTQRKMFHDETKMCCIKRILETNQICRNFRSSKDLNYDKIRKAMMFEDYEDLYKVIKRINDEWEELLSRGFVYIRVIDDFDAVLRHTKKERTEKEKMKLFMGVLDGKFKFKPVYAKVAYEIVPLWKTKKTIKENANFQEYCLKEKEQ